MTLGTLNDVIDSKIDTFDFDILRDRYIAVTGDTDRDFDNAVREFRRYLKLIARTDKPLAVLSRRVDELWHTFIIFTPQYRAFCLEVFGEYIDHQPHTKDFVVPKEALQNVCVEYERHFGPMTDLWLDNVDQPTISWLKGDASAPEHIGYRWSGWTGRIRRREG